MNPIVGRRASRLRVDRSSALRPTIANWEDAISRSVHDFAFPRHVSPEVLLHSLALLEKRAREGRALAPAIRGQNAHGWITGSRTSAFPRDGFAIYRTWQEGAASVSIPPWIHSHGDSTRIRIRPNVKTSVFHCRGHPRDFRSANVCAPSEPPGNVLQREPILRSAVRVHRIPSRDSW